MKKVLFLIALTATAAMGQREFTQYKVDTENSYIEFSIPHGNPPADPPSITIRTPLKKNSSERTFNMYREVGRPYKNYPTYFLIDGFTVVGSVRMITLDKGELYLDNRKKTFSVKK